MSIRNKSELYSLSNEELVSLSQNGNEAAKAVLTERFFNTRGLCVRSSYLDEDDFIQESMLGFLNALDTYDASKGVPFEAYALVCMRHKIFTAAKKRYEIPVGDSSALLENKIDSSNPLDAVILNERLSNVIDACEECLSKTEKAVVFLIAGGLSYDEVGQRLGMLPKSVDNALQRARRKLKNSNN